MARKVKVSVREGSVAYVRLEEKAWLDAGGKPVPDGDPNAASLIGPRGREFLWAQAVAFGLVDDAAHPREAALEDILTVEELKTIASGRGLEHAGIKRMPLLEVIRESTAVPVGAGSRGGRKRRSGSTTSSGKTSAKRDPTTE